MKFKIGGWHYRVRISDEVLRDELGRESAALFSWQSREIWISGSLSLEQRYDALLHELAHAYRHHMGAPGDEEGQANQHSTFTMDIVAQLDRQGGIWALGVLKADGMAEADASNDLPAMRYAIECPECQGKISLGDVSTDEPEFDHALRCLVVNRLASCDFCGRAIRWVERATSTGKPSGVVVSVVTSGASTCLSAGPLE